MKSLTQNKFFRQWFGDFSPEELKKFLKLGLIFAIIIGIYWTLRPMKDSLFQALVGGEYQPWAKIVSLLTVFPLVIAYSKLVETLPRKKLFYALSIIYGLSTLLLAYLFSSPTIGLAAKDYVGPYRYLGWVWYVFVESFGSLLVALFWAFTTDITVPESAKRGFTIIVLIGQIGGIIAPQLLPGLPKWMPAVFGLPSVIALCGFGMFLIIPLIQYFLATTPKELLESYNEETPAADDTHQKEVEPGFLEGLRLMISQPYLLGIFGIIFFYETIVTVIDYHFKLMAQSTIPNEVARTIFLGDYATAANLATFLCLLFGIGNITRRLGVTTALAIMPGLVALAVFVFKFSTTLTILFWIMVAAKAVNYALNSPAMKQLYVPTTEEARYKSQAWIESFGSRGSKATGSALNNLHSRFLVAFNGPEWANVKAVRHLLYKTGDLGTSWHIAIMSYLFFGVCGIWFFVALYLGRTYQKAVDQKKVVC